MKCRIKNPFLTVSVSYLQSFGSNSSPATPSGYQGPYTPGTPSHNIYGGDAYSPMQQTPSPMIGTPLTPGSGLIPLSPMTPAAQYEDRKYQTRLYASPGGGGCFILKGATMYIQGAIETCTPRVQGQNEVQGAENFRGATGM